MSTKRFRIAFSFAGEKRAFVAKVADILAQCFATDGKPNEEAILYDKFHEAEFARYDLGIRLPILYGEESDLIVPVLCAKYDAKRWTGWEWVHIYGLLTKEDGHRVMFCRFDRATVNGLAPAAGFIELDDKSPEQLARLILERLALNEKQPKDFYAEKLTPILGSPVTIHPPPPATLHKENNPFQTAAALTHYHPTYLRRPSDAAFAQLLTGPDHLLSITGEFGIGKSSLMQQARRILPDHEFFGGGMADMNGHDEARFMKSFFKLFERRFGVINDWDELDEHLSRTPSVLLLDDLGEVAAPGLGALIPALVKRVTGIGATLRVISTTRQTLKKLFAERGLDNPRNSRPWKNIHVGPFQETEARPLLTFLPPRSQALATAQFPRLAEQSQLKPQPLQCLCRCLFNAECNDLPDSQLLALIHADASYE